MSRLSIFGMNNDLPLVPGARRAWVESLPSWPRDSILKAQDGGVLKGMPPRFESRILNQLSTRVACLAGC